jgi:uroporphyrinogen-III synthase
MAAEPQTAAPPCVVVTRPQPQADEWVAQLQALGLPAGALPLLDIASPADPAPVRQAWRELATQALVMFVSPSAVDRFFALQPQGPASAAWPAGVIAAGVGPGTRRALRQAGVPDAAITAPGAESAQFDSEALWALLRAQRPWAGAMALVVRGEGGREWLADTLRQQGAQVQYVEAYRRIAPVPNAAGAALLQAALAQPAAHCWLFSSSEAAGHLPLLAPGADWTASLALATHARIAEAARRLGFGQVRQVSPSPQAVAEALRLA